MRIPPALEAIYRERHPYVVVVKPSQVGATEMNINLALWAAATNQGGRGSVLYLMPTQELADRASQRRFGGAFAQSPALRKLIVPAGDGSRPAQRIQMRSVGPGVIYLSGADQVSQYTGSDADLVVLDEFDQMREEVLSNAYARLRSSKLGWLRVTSTPTIPEFGVHGLLMRSDERHYHLHCASCGVWIEPQYPTNVDFAAGRVVCDCGAPLDAWGDGRWQALRPELTDVRGYQLNRLCLPNPPIEQMRMAASGTIGLKVEEFWRQDLGIPYVTADARLTAAQLDNCRAEEPPAMTRARPDAVVMGVDVGQDHFWVVVRLFAKLHSYPLFVAKVHGEWDGLLDLIDRFNVGWVTVDAQPDTRGAKRFVNEAVKRRSCDGAFRVYYKQTGTEHEWDWSDRRITAVRTLSLDEMFDGFRRMQSLLSIEGRDLGEGHYYEHMQALVRTTELDDFGQAQPAYRHTRPDDFSHAENYITLVATRLGPWNGWWE
jgi:Phage terminase large subunit (GpA)